MKFRRIMAVFLCVMLFLPNTIFAEDAEVVKQYRVAKMYYDGEEMKVENCEISMSTYSGSLLNGERSGKFGRWIGPGAFGYITFRQKKDYWTSADNNEVFNVRIRIEYYDGGNGKFAVRYYTPDGDILKSKTTQLADTGQWKTEELVLTDIRLNGNMAFDVGFWSQEMGESPENVLIHSIMLEEILPPEPIQASLQTGHLGNMIDTDNRGEVKLHLKNLSDSSGVGEISYTVTDENGMSVYGAEQKKVDFKADGEYEIPVDVSSLKNGLYKLNVKVKSEFESSRGVESAEYIQVVDFSVIPMWSDGEERNDFYGVCGHVPQQTSPIIFELLSNAGFGKARVEVHPYWTAFMPDGKNFNYSYFEKHGGYFPEDVNHVQILGWGNPSVYNDSRTHMAMPHSDEEIDKYIEYAKELVRANDKYYDGVPTRWEVWNEPDHDPFNPTGETPEHYAKILKKVYPAIKEIDPDAIIVAGSTINDDVGFLRRVFDEIGTDYFDEISLHPYSFTAKKDGGLQAMTNTALSVQSLMKEYGEVKPIGYTEIGWHSSGDGHVYGVSEMEQAQYAVMMPVVSLAYNAAQYVIWYDLINDGQTPGNMEHHFGLTTAVSAKDPYAAKPSYAAISTYNSLMPNAKYKEKVEFNGMRTAAYCFDRTVGDNIAVMWSYDKNRIKSLDLSCDSVDVYDMYGNHLETLKGANGVFTFALTENPIYVIGNFNSFKEAETQIEMSDFDVMVVDDMLTVSVNDKNGRNLKVEVVPESQDIVCENIVDMVSGKARFDIKTSMTAQGDNEFRIKLYDELGVYYIGEHSVSISELFEATAETVQLFENSNTRWQIKVTVQNMANKRVLAGDVELLEPIEYAKVAKKVYFTDLKPKQKRSFYLNIPEIIAKRTVNVKTKITVDGGYSEELANSVDFTTAYYAVNKPVIDGKIDANEWRGDWVYSDKLEYIEGGLEKNWGGSDDLSLKAKFAWDEENFYLLVDVKDNILYNKESVANMWMDDCLQWGFDRITPQGEIVSTTFTEMGIGFVDGKPAMNKWSVQDSDQKAGEVTNFKAVINRTPTNTIYEVSVPWSEVFREGYDVHTCPVLGFSLMANDNDGNGRRGWIKYNGGIGLYKAPSEFGRMKLVK